MEKEVRWRGPTLRGPIDGDAGDGKCTPTTRGPDRRGVLAGSTAAADSGLQKLCKVVTEITRFK